MSFGVKVHYGTGFNKESTDHKFAAVCIVQNSDKHLLFGTVVCNQKENDAAVCKMPGATGRLNGSSHFLNYAEWAICICLCGFFFIWPWKNCVYVLSKATTSHACWALVCQGKARFSMYTIQFASQGFPIKHGAHRPVQNNENLVLVFINHVFHCRSKN